VVSDIEGNVIWYYPIQPQFPFPIKLLPNGHMLVVLANEIREVDLAGNLIYGLPLVQVQTALAAQGMSLPPLTNFNHDILKLPNGHLILMITLTQTVTDPPGTGDVIGNLLVDWDPQEQRPVWTWNTFDHLQISRAPDGLPDWTHANALVYSPDDGHLLMSMRNQDWIIKINYADGAGDGSILWRLGPDGDFTLPAGVGPVEWNYGQHNPVIVSPNSAGIFSLMFFNNGSQILSERDLSPAYSICCGSVGLLSNGNLEYDIAFDIYTPNTSTIREETPPPSSELVWQMVVTGELVYRGDRIPSLYPGVAWTQSAQATANAAAIHAADKAAGTH
jgi:arylsulfate sulfotransferase